MSKQSTTPIGESVMNQIKSGKVHMKPRAYYVSLGIISVATITLAGVSLAYFWSIIFFWVRIQTADTMAWGARENLSEAIASFPWWALIVSLILLTAAVLLVRRQGRMYRHKTRTIALAIVSCSLLLGLGLSSLNIGQSHTPGQPNQRQGQGARQLQR